MAETNWKYSLHSNSQSSEEKAIYKTGEVIYMWGMN